MRHIPNILTCLNLFSGCIAVVAIFHGRMDYAALLICASLAFDFLDGFVARITNSYSEFGKQMDSLADVITFGLVPGLILYHLMLKSNFFILFENRLLFSFFKYYMFIVPVFSALRLAKFNLDKRQSDYFVGLPTPANTIMILSLPLIVSNDHFGLTPYILNPLMLAGIASISAFLLVAEIPLIPLKFKRGKSPEFLPKMILIGGSLLLLAVLRYAAGPAIIIFYIILSLIYPPDKTTS